MRICVCTLIIVEYSPIVRKSIVRPPELHPTFQLWPRAPRGGRRCGAPLQYQSLALARARESGRRGPTRCSLSAAQRRLIELKCGKRSCAQCVACSRLKSSPRPNYAFICFRTHRPPAPPARLLAFLPARPPARIAWPHSEAWTEACHAWTKIKKKKETNYILMRV